jgi:hypothetical protein
MKMGAIGIVSEKIFDECEDSIKYLYLTMATDVTEYWQKVHPEKNFKKTIYEIRYKLLEPKEPFICTAVYLHEFVIPDKMISDGADHKMSIENFEKWKYHKVLLTLNGKSEVCYLHERCLKYFTWYSDTE